jgi:UDP-N-acetylglucosamine--N-acetylmuramyl-(pentapeptide) pyrophosphoryl-undecaprenol N-acetylglucosamine transferase
MKEANKYRFLFAGGGTGGHLFPAVAVAEEIKMQKPEADIMFIGTASRIEGKLVPGLGYKFKSIWIQGFSRKMNLNNILFPLKLTVSIIQSLFINLGFRPRVAIGSGGYASGPAVFAASLTGAKVMLLEQNSFPGVTTRILQKYADEIHISFQNSAKYLKKKENIYLTGNPVRSSLKKINKAEALKAFSLSADKKVLLVLGGSLGAASINEAVVSLLPVLKENNIQLIWQTGKNYFKRFNSYSSINIFVSEFISDMNLAYSSCDLLISRAGATTIAEILVLEIPCIIVPSPNVAENHQYHNAEYLSQNGAAVLINDNEVKEKLPAILVNLIKDDNKLKTLRDNCRKISKPGAAHIIAERAIRYAEA